MAQIRLHVQQADGYLPAVCMCCGEPATAMINRRMSWCPPWVGGIIALALTKYARVQAPFCDRHKGHWFKRALTLWGSLFLFVVIGVGSLILAGSLPHPTDETALVVAGIGCGVLFVAWIVMVFVCQLTAIRPTLITDEEICLTGVCAEFVDAVDEEEREYRRRRAERRRRQRERWRNDYDDEDEPGRRRRGRDDRYED